MPAALCVNLAHRSPRSRQSRMDDARAYRIVYAQKNASSRLTRQNTAAKDAFGLVAKPDLTVSAAFDVKWTSFSLYRRLGVICTTHASDQNSGTRHHAAGKQIGHNQQLMVAAADHTCMHSFLKNGADRPLTGRMWCAHAPCSSHAEYLAWESWRLRPTLDVRQLES
jgi:hypothetical protein